MANRYQTLGPLPEVDGHTVRSCAPHAMAIVLSQLTKSNISSEEVLYKGQKSLKTILDYGMGLAEAGDTIWCLSDLTRPSGYEVDVEVVFANRFDVKALREAIAETLSNPSAFHVVNFYVSVAHNFDEKSVHGKFGHWSTIAGIQGNNVVMYDSDPVSFGRYWRCPIERLFAAITFKSGKCTRGLIRISLSGTSGSQLSQFSECPTRNIIRRWQAIHPVENNVSRLYSEFNVPFAPFTKLQSLHILTFAVSKLGVSMEEQELVSKLRIPCKKMGAYNTWSFGDSGHILPEMLQIATEALKTTKLRAEAVQFQSADAKLLRSYFSQHTGPNFFKHDLHLVCFDSKTAHKRRDGGVGAEIDGIHWGLVAGFDATTDQLLIADSDFDTYGRIWCCDLQAMADALVGTMYGMLRICEKALRPMTIGESLQSQDLKHEEQTSQKPTDMLAMASSLVDAHCTGLNGLAALSMAISRITESSMTIDELIWTIKPQLETMNTLRTTLSTLCNYAQEAILTNDLPLRVDVVHFDKMSVVEKQVTADTLSAFLSNCSGVIIFNFDASLLSLDFEHLRGSVQFGTKKGSTGHFSVLDSFDEKTGTATLSDPVFGSKWQVGISKLVAACSKKEGGDNALDKAGRARGLLRLSLNSVPRLTGLGRVENVELAHYVQLKSKYRLDYQQALNCCGAVSLGYALSQLGHPYHCDDIFATCHTRIRRVVAGEGFSLLQLAECASEFVARKGLPLRVEAVSADPGEAPSMQDFQSLAAVTCKDPNSVIILNFAVGFAHGMQGGGHFSMLADVLEDSNELVVADVNPMKYLHAWRNPIEWVWAGMRDCASTAGSYMYGQGGPGKRPRGFIRISTQSTAPLDPMKFPSENMPVSWFRSRLMKL